MARQVTIGRTVLYRLDSMDVDAIRKSRATAVAASEFGGFMRPVEVSETEGCDRPMVVVACNPVVRGPGVAPMSVNGQVFLDGPDTLWVRGVTEGSGLAEWRWPEMVNA